MTACHLGGGGVSEFALSASHSPSSVAAYRCAPCVAVKIWKPRARTAPRPLLIGAQVRPALSER